MYVSDTANEILNDDKYKRIHSTEQRTRCPTEERFMGANYGTLNLWWENFWKILSVSIWSNSLLSKKKDVHFFCGPLNASR